MLILTLAFKITELVNSLKTFFILILRRPRIFLAEPFLFYRKKVFRLLKTSFSIDCPKEHPDTEERQGLFGIRKKSKSNPSFDSQAISLIISKLKNKNKNLFRGNMIDQKSCYNREQG
jgi:hypothetical protein